MFSSRRDKRRSVAGGLLLAALGIGALVMAEAGPTDQVAEADDQGFAATGVVIAVPLLLVSAGLQP